ncbi:MAG: hypothetical protein P8Z42_03420, partial [Anaerolineales bacterium]
PGRLSGKYHILEFLLKRMSLLARLTETYHPARQLDDCLTSLDGQYIGQNNVHSSISILIRIQVRLPQRSEP